MAGRQFEISAAEVSSLLADCSPEPIHQYWVEIDGVRWPVKQVIALATGLKKSEFQSSQNSRGHLTKLGFRIGEGNEEISTPPRGSPTGPKRVGSSPNRSFKDPDVTLVSCVKSKLQRGAPAKDLYTSDYFAKMRAYAESTGVPWFILSAEHGLVNPDAWLEPYDCYLPETTREYRRAWGQKVSMQLQEALGSLDGLVIEVHAGAAYAESAATALRPLGAVIVDRLKGLSFGRRLSWYSKQGTPRPSADEVIAQLRDHSKASAPDDPLASKDGMRSPGLYSWWVDKAGARELSEGLGHDIPAGLIYVGSAGATRSGGSRSGNTLWGRIMTMHLGKRHNFSTLRLSLGSTLAITRRWRVIDEAELTGWMLAHLQVVIAPVSNADTLGVLESAILSELDPPLNIAKVPKTALRSRLSELRKQYSGTRSSMT